MNSKEARKWQATDAETARRCESMFQSGGPRVYVMDGETLKPCGWSAASAVRYSFPGQVVYARRKSGKLYEWKSYAVTEAT